MIGRTDTIMKLLPGITTLVAVLGAVSPIQAAPAPHAAPAENSAGVVMTSKPAVPVAITHEVVGSPQVGNPVEIILTVSPGRDISGMVILLSAEDPLAIIEPPGDVLIGEVAAGDAAEISITVLPLLDQTHYLSVTVRGAMDGALQSRTIAVPIRLPGAAADKSDDAASEKAADGELLRSFEAIETLH
jgi:hypothetical protein